MRRAERRFVEDTCSYIQSRTGADTDDWAEEIEANIDGLLGEVTRIQRQAKSLVRKGIQPLLTSFDLALLVMSELTLAVHEMENDTHPAVWPELQAAHPEGTKPSRLFLLLMTNLTNTLLAMRTLVCAGLDYQARVLFRSFAELADATVVALYDSKFFIDMCTSEPTFANARKRWQRYLRPSRVQAKYREMLAELGTSAAVQEAYLQSLQGTLDWLSQWTHNNIIPLSMGFMPPEIGGDNCRFGLGGRASRASEATLEAALEHVVLFLQLATGLLAGNHGWNLQSENLKRFSRWYGILQVMHAQIRGAVELLDLSPPSSGTQELSEDELELLRAFREFDEQWKWSYQVALGRLVLYQHSPVFQSAEGEVADRAAREFLYGNLLQLQGVSILWDDRKPYVDTSQLAELLATKSDKDRRHIEFLVKQLQHRSDGGGMYGADAQTTP